MEDGTCKIREKLAVQETRFEADLQLITISFGQDIMWSKEVKPEDYTLAFFSDSGSRVLEVFSPESTRPISDYEGLNQIKPAEIKSVSIRSNTLRIQLKITQTVESGTSVLILPAKYKIQKVGDPSVAIYVRAIEISPINYIITDMEKAMEQAQKPVSTAVTTITTLLLIISIPQAFVLMKVFQTIDYYIYIDCIYPTNFSAFLQMISKDLLGMIPNIFTFMADDEGKPVYNRFEQFGLNIHFLLNVGVHLSLLMALGILKMITLGIVKIFPRVKLLKSKLSLL